MRSAARITILREKVIHDRWVTVTVMLRVRVRVLSQPLKQGKQKSEEPFTAP